MSLEFFSDRLDQHLLCNRVLKMAMRGDFTVKFSGPAGEVVEKRSRRILQDDLELLIADITELVLHGRSAARGSPAANTQFLAC